MSVSTYPYQPATMTMAVAPTYANNMVYETVAQPAQFQQFTGTTTYAAAPTYSTVAAPTYTTMAAPTMVETVSAAPNYATYAQPQYVAPMTGTVTYKAGGSVSAPLGGTQSYTTIQQGGSVSAPLGYAAPTAQYVQTPSYVAPQVIQTSRSVAALEVPVSLLQGIPTPDQIKSQSAAYASALDKQLKDGTETIAKETEIEKNMIKFNADKQLALFQMQVEEQRNEQLAFLDEQATIRQCELRKAYVERKLQLDNQANGFVMDYQMKCVQTELAQKQYEFNQTYVGAENKLQAEYDRQVALSNTGTSYSIPAQAVR